MMLNYGSVARRDRRRRINDQITADVLTATARDGIGASDDLDTEVNSLDASVTGTGDIRY
jgi:hypothetical protein